MDHYTLAEYLKNNYPRLSLGRKDFCTYLATIGQMTKFTEINQSVIKIYKDFTGVDVGNFKNEAVSWDLQMAYQNEINYYDWMSSICHIITFSTICYTVINIFLGSCRGTK